MFRNRTHWFLVSGFALAFALPALSDQATFELQNNAWNGNPNVGTYLPSSGALIDYELFVRLEDVESDGLESQGLASFSFNILTDTGIQQPLLSFSPTTVEYPYVTIIDELWTGGKAPVAVGGMGFSFLFDDGAAAGDDVVGAGGLMSPIWIADTATTVPGITPRALANIGIGSPDGGVFDSGGNSFPFYGTARGEWYLLRGQIAVPDTEGNYNVSFELETASVIFPNVDLNQDQQNGYIETIANNHTIVSNGFSFSVVPEPATAGAMLFLASIVCRRRGR